MSILQSLQWAHTNSRTKLPRNKLVRAVRRYDESPGPDSRAAGLRICSRLRRDSLHSSGGIGSSSSAAAFSAMPAAAALAVRVRARSSLRIVSPEKPARSRVRLEGGQAALVERAAQGFHFSRDGLADYGGFVGGAGDFGEGCFDVNVGDAAGAEFARDAVSALAAHARCDCRRTGARRRRHQDSGARAEARGCAGRLRDRRHAVRDICASRKRNRRGASARAWRLRRALRRIRVCAVRGHCGRSIGVGRDRSKKEANSD